MSNEDGGRPRLNLKPRDPNAVKQLEEQRAKSSNNPFGGWVAGWLAEHYAHHHAPAAVATSPSCSCRRPPTHPTHT